MKHKVAYSPFDRFFVWQVEAYGTGEIDDTLPADVFKARLMPATPQGDIVCRCATAASAIKIVEALNRGDFEMLPWIRGTEP